MLVSSRMRTSPALDLRDQPIAEGIGGLRLGLQLAAPLNILDPLPEGVTVEAIVKTEESENIWAIGDLRRFSQEMQENNGYRKGDDDVSSPHVLAVAAENDKGGKAVIISSFDFATDAYSRARMTVRSGRMVVVQPFPGNMELMLNSVFWLNDNDNRIGAGPLAQVRLIGKIDKGALRAWRWTVWAGWPAMALIVGAVICFIRRR